MVLGISYAELIVLTATGFYLIGAKDLPRVAKQAGLFTGRAVSYISALRKQAFSYADETELVKLHQEVQASMQQLQAIRSEMRSGMNVFSNPRQSFAKLPEEQQQWQAPQSQSSGTPPAKAEAPQARVMEGNAKAGPLEPSFRGQPDRRREAKGSTNLMQELLDEEMRLHRAKKSS